MLTFSLFQILRFPEPLKKSLAYRYAPWPLRSTVVLQNVGLTAERAGNVLSRTAPSRSAALASRCCSNGRVLETLHRGGKPPSFSCLRLMRCTNTEFRHKNKQRAAQVSRPLLSCRLVGLVSVAPFGDGDLGVIDAEKRLGYDLDSLAGHTLIVRILAGPELSFD
jgi:hypothetical protein